jgi:hypothetical protein
MRVVGSPGAIANLCREADTPRPAGDGDLGAIRVFFLLAENAGPRSKLITTVRPSTLAILYFLLQNRISHPGHQDFFLHIHISRIHHPL